jgi:hypothetical protein
MSSHPSTHGGNGQGRNGRFLSGNKLGRGNPLAGRAAKLRAVLLRALTPSDMKAIADRLVVMAKKGDLAAIKELFDRTIGRAAASDPTERIDGEILVKFRPVTITPNPDADALSR